MSAISSMWGSRRLGDCGTWLSGGTPSTHNPAFWNGDIPWISSSSLTQFRVKQSPRCVTQLGAVNGTRLIPPGTVIFVVRGMSLISEFRVGVTDAQVAFGQDCKAIIPQSDVDPTYLGYALRHAERRVLALVDRASHGTGRLHVPSLQDFEIPMPDLPEQQRIADTLTDLDDHLANLRELRQKGQGVLDATMRKLITGETRLNEFDAPWETVRIESICDVVSGGTPSTSEPSYWDGGIPWCTPSDITAQSGPYLLKTERTITSAGLSASSAQLLPVGSLLLCTRATVGAVKLAAFPVATNQGFKSLVCGPRMGPRFLYYALLIARPHLESKGVGSTFLEVSKKDVGAMEVPLPDRREQEAIAEVLWAMEENREKLDRLIEKTEGVKAAMMDELLTGRTRLA